MADTKISALTELDAEPAGTDEFAINDAGTTKKITVTNLMKAAPNRIVMNGGSTSTLTNTVDVFYDISQSNVAITESANDAPISFAWTLTRFVAVITGMTKATNQVVVLRDDAADTNGIVTVTASTTGIYDSGAISDSIAAGSLLGIEARLSVSGNFRMGWIIEGTT